MNAPLPTADDGWIEWTGGECPVEPETRVDVVFRDGAQWDSYFAGHLDDLDATMSCWRHTADDGDIIAYRVVRA